MTDGGLTRREWLAAGTFVGTAAVAQAQTLPAKASGNVKYSFNTSTIRGQKVGLAREVEIAAEAGYDAIEPWMGTINDFVKGGGSLKDLGKKARDLGLTVESAIGFARWIVDDDAERAKGFEEAKRDMDSLQQLGGKRIAAPPVGAHDKGPVDLMKAAERYRQLCELGRQFGIVPEVEVWGFSKALSRLGETAFVALESAHPDATILPDIYHLFKGGSGFEGLRLLSSAAVQVFHVNDYPADLPRDKIADKDRVYPGDGIAPMTEILRSVIRPDRPIVLSLELFNPQYWKQDALLVAQTGLEKTKAAVAKAAG
ncbi:MAG: sugar phosphate isomerase/epimerase [Planctomycetes bacterium]|nr:sugar phosphate isomerase/epimerase [Planctomycetota bacterium]